MNNHRFLGYLIDRVRVEIRGGLEPVDAVQTVCELFGYDDDGSVYRYLMNHFVFNK